MNKQELIEEINKTKEYLANMEKMYLELEEIIEPRLLDDFCGYNEEAQGFDLALAIKQIIETKEQEGEELKDKINYMEEYIKTVENARNDLERELKRKEQKLQEAMDNYVKLDNQRVKEYNELVDKYNNKEQECEELKEEKAEIKKYLGISDKTIIQRLEELQEFKDELKMSEYNYKQALDEIEKYLDIQQKYFDGEDYHNLLDIINKAKKGN